MAGTFPIQRARERLGFTPSTAVRADIDVRTGQEAIGRAVSGLGGEIAGLGIKLDVMQGKTQADNAERDARLSMVQFLNEVRQEDNVDSWDALFNEHNERVVALTPSNARGARQYNATIKNLAPGWTQRFGDLKAVKLEDNMISASMTKVNDLLDSATIDNMNLVATKIKTELTIRGRLSPSISKVDTTRAKASVEHDIQLSIAKKMALRVPEIAIESIKGDKMEGFDSLTPDDILRIRNIATSTLTQTQIAVKQADDAIGEGFLKLLVNKLEPTKPQLTFDMIVTSNLSLDAKQTWFQKLRTFDNYSESELKEAFTDKGEVLADIYDRIDQETITDNQIREQVGDGLSPATAQRMIKEIRVPYERDTDQIFKRIFGWTPEFGFGEKRFAPFAYEKVLRDWKAEIKKQDASGEKIIEIGREIARPYFLEHLKIEGTVPDADIPRMVELALGEEKLKTPKPIESEVPMKEPGEPTDYPSFEVEVSRLKGIDREKARQYYDAWIDKFRKGPEE